MQRREASKREEGNIGDTLRSEVVHKSVVGSASYGHSTHLLFSHFVERILPKNAYDGQLLQRRVSSAPTPVPTLAFHGTRDRPGRLEAFEGMDDLFLKGLEKVVYPGAGHFVHLERPAEVNQRIVDFLRAT